jgi:peptide deformylase
MAILSLKYIPDQILRAPTKNVEKFDSELSQIISNMWDTMYSSKGIGLAAPQVGISQKITVIDLAEDNAPKLVLINPQIIGKAGKVSSEEGCLSIPEFRETINRARIVRVRAQNEKGQEFEIEADGLLSRCLQHEIDHLNGILFTDHLSRLKRDFFKKWLELNPEFSGEPV